MVLADDFDHKVQAEQSEDDDIDDDQQFDAIKLEIVP